MDVRACHAAGGRASSAGHAPLLRRQTRRSAASPAPAIVPRLPLLVAAEWAHAHSTQWRSQLRAATPVAAAAADAGAVAATHQIHLKTLGSAVGMAMGVEQSVKVCARLLERLCWKTITREPTGSRVNARCQLRGCGDSGR